MTGDRKTVDRFCRSLGFLLSLEKSRVLDRSSPVERFETSLIFGRSPVAVRVQCLYRIVISAGDAMMFKAVASVMLLALAACTSGRVATVNEAQSQMIGMSKEQILRCMGPPHSSYVVGSSTEVWAYNSAAQNASAAPACIVNVMMQDSQVIDIDYRPIGGFLKKDKQCSYAVEKCIN